MYMTSENRSITRRLRSRAKPGLLKRLGHLIVAQVVFVFAAIALLIFGPSQEVSFSTWSEGHQEEFAALADRVATLVEGQTTQPGRLPDLSGEKFQCILTQQPAIKQAALYCSDAYGVRQSSERFTQEKYEGEQLWDDGAVPYIDVNFEDYEGGLPPAFPIELTEDYIVYGSPVRFADGSHGMFVASWDHKLYLSDRSALGYALLILFLCSALIALLTVHLMRRRFVQPFETIIEGLEKTTDGVLVGSLQRSGERELAQLSRLTTKLSERLKHDRDEIRRYDSELRSASDSLEESQQLLSTVIEHTPAGVITTNPEGEILVFNQRATEIFGYENADAIGTHLDILFTRSVMDRTDQGVAAGDKGMEVIGKRTDGSQFAAFLIGAPLVNERRDCIGHVFIVRDISESTDFREMMIRLDRYYTKGEMASEIAHEINNYLSILMGNIELVPLLLRKGNMDRLDKKLELMHGTVEKIARFTDGLLDGSHDEVRFEPADINQIVQNVIAFLKPQNRFDHTEVITDLSGDLPLCEVDPGLIQQVLVNLIYNAGDAVYENDGERWVRVATSVTGDGDSRELLITVEDNGPGVQQDKEPLMFKKRFTTKSNGHGIGLITCRKILDSHLGSITYERTGGALFTVTVPVNHPAGVADLESAGISAGSVE